MKKAFVLRKILSGAVVSAMLLSQLCFSVNAQNDEGLYFELDLSQYSDTNRVAKNKVNNSSDGVMIRPDENNQSVYPEVGTISSINGTKKYIVTGTCDEDNGNAITERGFINLDNTYATQTLNDSDYTVELWLRSDKPAAVGGYRKILNLSNSIYSDSLSDTKSVLQIDTNGANKTVYRYRTGKATLGTAFTENTFTAFTKGEWTHFVITRQWDSETSKWTDTLYQNGSRIKTWTGGLHAPQEYPNI